MTGLELMIAGQAPGASLAKPGHSRMAKRVAAWVPGYAYDEARFFAADGAPPEVRGQPPRGLCGAGGELNAAPCPQHRADPQAREQIPDLQFTGAYRVPFQFSPYLRQHLSVGAFVQRSRWASRVTDLDGNA
jgi:glutamate-1-semialdehyde 2,1-aminomutase